MRVARSFFGAETELGSSNSGPSYESQVIVNESNDVTNQEQIAIAAETVVRLANSTQDL